jgi:hypothetical protein
VDGRETVVTQNDDLQSQLRRADSSVSLTPLTPDETTRLLEATMTTTIPTRNAVNRPWRASPSPLRRRSFCSLEESGWRPARSHR